MMTYPIALARKDAALKLAVEALEEIGDQSTHPHAKLPSAWAKGDRARRALAACREAQL